MQLRFASFAVINLRRDLHPQERAHAGRTKKGPGDYPSPLRYLVEPGGIEPPSASPPQAVLHVYSVNFLFSLRGWFTDKPSFGDSHSFKTLPCDPTVPDSL